MRKHLLAALLVGISAAPAVAQQKGTIEIGGFIKFTDYDKSFEATRKSANSWGGGGRLGYFFSPRWELEADGSGNATDAKEFFVGFESTGLTYYPFHLRLNFNQKLGENSPFTFILGAGPAYNRYGKDIPGQPGFKGSDWGASGLAGIRAKLTNWLHFRVDGTIDYIPSPNNGKDDIVSQANGITASSPASSNTNLGAQVGLSVMLGMCTKSKDGTTISPTTANIQTGGSANFSATATNCGKPDMVVYTVSGPGSVDASGRYTSNTAGTATVTACGAKNRLCSSATVNVTAPPPPPPPRTLTRCELSPATASPRIDQPVSYSVTCFYSDGTSEPVTSFTLSSPGGSVSGNAISWSTPGNKNITATLTAGGPLTATADVQQFVIVVRDSVYFMVDKTVIYRTDDQQQLNEIAKTLKDHPDIKLVIDGHADADGSVKYNERLAMNRAISLKNYLAGQGVPVDRMTIVLRSFGECVPVAPNATAEGRTLNRRAELREFGNTPPGEASAACAEAGRERKP